MTVEPQIKKRKRSKGGSRRKRLEKAADSNKESPRHVPSPELSPVTSPEPDEPELEDMEMTSMNKGEKRARRDSRSQSHESASKSMFHLPSPPSKKQRFEGSPTPELHEYFKNTVGTQGPASTSDQSVDVASTAETTPVASTSVVVDAMEVDEAAAKTKKRRNKGGPRNKAKKLAQQELACMAEELAKLGVQVQNQGDSTNSAVTTTQTESNDMQVDPQANSKDATAKDAKSTKKRKWRRKRKTKKPFKSHWDRLPPELHIAIFEHCDWYTRYINYRLSKDQIKEHKWEIHTDAHRLAKESKNVLFDPVKQRGKLPTFRRPNGKTFRINKRRRIKKPFRHVL
ncbi:hypothetical protein HDU76_010487 [Blyttiomyces sp. JEL0837]|nr:hypothetical protein HDU76_010487 [Blyttiomyces sp. JEL0837]